MMPPGKAGTQAPPEVKVVLAKTADKKSATRYDGGDDDAVAAFYLKKAAVKAIGDPDAIELIIRPA